MTSVQTARTPATIRINVMLSIVHLVRFEKHTNLAMQEMREEVADGNQCWPNYNHSHRWKDAEDQGRNQLDGCLGCPFFSLLTALCSERIREGAQRLGNRRSEAIGLNQHRHKGACTFEIRPHCKRLPCRIALNACPLFEIDEQQFL